MTLSLTLFRSFLTFSLTLSLSFFNPLFKFLWLFLKVCLTLFQSFFDTFLVLFQNFLTLSLSFPDFFSDTFLFLFWLSLTLFQSFSNPNIFESFSINSLWFLHKFFSFSSPYSLFSPLILFFFLWRRNRIHSKMKREINHPV